MENALNLAKQLRVYSTQQTIYYNDWVGLAGMLRYPKGYENIILREITLPIVGFGADAASFDG